MEEENQESFFKKIVISIKDFERYPMLAGEKWKVVLAYLLKLLAIFTFIVVIAFVYTTLKQVEKLELSRTRYIYK